MSREVGFYLMVPGMCIYLSLLCLVYYFPVMDAMQGTLLSDTAIFYSFLFLVFYPISLLLMRWGNVGLRIFSFKWVAALSVLPFLGALVVIFLA